MALLTPLYARPGFAVLAQVRAVEVPPLPGPPFIESLLFERPWIGIVALLLGAVVALFVLNARGKAKQGAAAAGAMLLAAAGLWGLAAAVQTDRERLIENTRELVDATALADIESLDRLLAPNARGFHRGAPRGMDRDAVLAWVADQLGESGDYRLKDHGVIETQATLDGDRVGRTQVRVGVVPAAWEVPIDSWWRVDWNRDDAGVWRVTGIRPLVIKGIPNP